MGTIDDYCFYKIYKKNDMTYYDVHFNSLAEVQRFLRENPARNTRVFLSNKSESPDEEFAGPPLEKAIDLCLGGFTENYDTFFELSRRLESLSTGYTVGRKTERSFVGQRPNVPAYIAGAPKTMYHLSRVQPKKKISICMNVVYTGHTSDAEIMNRGIVAINLINLLEKNNYMVDFRLFEVSKIDKEIFKCEVVLKRPGERFEPSLCYYPMCGKGFVRRILPRIKESMSFTANWGLSYGMVLDEKSVRQILGLKESDIYIGSPREMGITGRDIFADADAFIKKISLDKEIRVPNYSEEGILLR